MFWSSHLWRVDAEVLEGVQGYEDVTNICVDL